MWLRHILHLLALFIMGSHHSGQLAFQSTKSKIKFCSSCLWSWGFNTETENLLTHYANIVHIVLFFQINIIQILNLCTNYRKQLFCYIYLCVVCECVCVYAHVPHCVHGGRRLTEGVSSICLLVWQVWQQVHYLLIHIAELRI